MLILCIIIIILLLYNINIQIKYLPKRLTKKDKKKQAKQLKKSRAAYKKKFIYLENQFLLINQKNHNI